MLPQSFERGVSISDTSVYRYTCLFSIRFFVYFFFFNQKRCSDVLNSACTCVGNTGWRCFFICNDCCIIAIQPKWPDGCDLVCYFVFPYIVLGCI